MNLEIAKKLYSLWKTDILAFVEDILGHFLTHKVPDFHKEIYKLLIKTKRLVLAAPRGFAKSMICSVFYPLHQALFGLKQDICVISASETLAIEWLRKIRRELELNPRILRFFGDLKSDKWTETHIILKNKVNIRARGAGGQIRGFRPDLIVLDDIETDESVASEEQRNKLRDWIFKACLNTLLPEGQFIMIGTIISPLSLLNEILNSDINWEKRKFQAYIDGIQEKGHESWSALWSHERLQQRKKEIGTFAFASEYMNDPVSNETAPIKQHQIRYWEELPQQYSCVIAIDPAYSDDDKADYKVASVVAIDQNNNRYLVTYLRTHKPTGEFIDGILNLYLQYKDKLTAIGIPAQGTEKEFYNSVLRKAEERKLYPPFVELKNAFTDGSGITHRKKIRRVIAALQPLFEAGKYYIHKNHTEAKDELLSIGASRWDDIIDSLAYAEQILVPVYFETETQKVGRYGELLSDEQYQPIFNYGY
jgi:phage terminase large subunit-like protein